MGLVAQEEFDRCRSLFKSRWMCSSGQRVKESVPFLISQVYLARAVVLDVDCYNAVDFLSEWLDSN